MNIIKKLFPNYKTKKELREEIEELKGIKFQPKLTGYEVVIEKLNCRSISNSDIEQYLIEDVKSKLSRDVKDYIKIKTIHHPYCVEVIGSLYVVKKENKYD